jgi:hypothetical protein
MFRAKNRRTLLAALAVSSLLVAMPAPGSARPRAAASKPAATAVKATPAAAPAVEERTAEAGPAATEATRAKTARRLIFDEGDTVEAGRDTGGGEVISGERRRPMSSLIKIREDFIPELVKSAEDL